MVAGVGGTGVITIGQLLGMAAHIEGKGIVTQDAAGLAQKGGATWSHVLIGEQAGRHPHDAGRAWPAPTSSSAAIRIVTAGKETVLRMREGRTHVALNSHSTPDGGLREERQLGQPADACAAEIAHAVGRRACRRFNADAAATKLMGDSIYTNPMMLGYAWQKGWIPLGRESLMRAIELNGVAVDNNKAAFEWGRRAAARLAVESKSCWQPAQVIEFKKRETLDSLVARRVEFLTGLPERGLCRQLQARSSRRCGWPKRRWARPALTEAVARYLFKLMAYKDEYEVARLHAETRLPGEDRRPCSRATTRSTYHLAPPHHRQDATTRASCRSSKFGPAMLTGVPRAGQAQGPARHGAGHLRRAPRSAATERALIGEYRASIEQVLRSLNAANHAAGGRDRAHSRADQGLRPRQGAQSGRRARALGSS